MIGLRLAVIEIESFADLDGDELRSVSSTWTSLHRHNLPAVESRSR
jgi:hypothetical protein